MKKKNGFTLIELLAVLIIISVILLLIGTQVFNKINNSKTTLYETQLEEIKKAARVYISKTNIDFDTMENNQITISLGELKKEGLVERDIKNPKDGKKLSDCITVTITKTGANNYKYTVNDDINQNDNCKISEEYSLILIGNANVQVKKDTTYKDDGILLKGNLGNFLDPSRIDVKIYINNMLYKDNLKFSNFENEIDTSILTTYRIEYLYENSMVSRIVRIVNEIKPVECLNPVITNIGASSYGTSKINLNYNINNASKVEIKYKKSTDTNYTYLDSIDCSLTGCVVSGLTAVTKYNFIIKAINNCEEEIKEIESNPIEVTTGTVSSPEFLNLSPINSSFINVGATNWTKENINFKIKYYDEGFITPQHYFYVESHETPTQDNITANKKVYYCGTTEPGTCQNTEITSGNRLQIGWYKVEDNEVILTYDREYEYHFTAITKDDENRKIATLTTNNIDKTSPNITIEATIPQENQIIINYAINDQLTDMNKIGSRIKTKTCKCGTSSSNLNKKSTTTTDETCTVDGLTADTTYYCKVYAEDNVGNTSESDLMTIKTEKINLPKYHVILKDCNGETLVDDYFEHGTEIGSEYVDTCYFGKTQYSAGITLPKSTFNGWTTSTNFYSNLTMSSKYMITKDITLYTVNIVNGETVTNEKSRPASYTWGEDNIVHINETTNVTAVCCGYGPNGNGGCITHKDNELYTAGSSFSFAHSCGGGVDGAGTSTCSCNITVDKICYNETYTKTTMYLNRSSKEQHTNYSTEPTTCH